MPETKRVALACCQFLHDVVFDEFENPLTAPSLLKRSLICPSCGRIVILALIHSGSGETVAQEIIADSN